MDRKKSREREGQKNIFTSLHSRSLSPGGVVRKGWAALLTAWQLAVRGGEGRKIMSSHLKQL